MKDNKNNSIIEKIRPVNYVKIYATNSFIGFSNQDIRIELCNEKLRDETNNKWGYIIDATIIFSPVGAKKMLNALNEKMKEYEKQFGTIDIFKEEGVIKFTK